MKRGCIGYGGKLKRAFANIDDALEECARHGGMSPYPCQDPRSHGLAKAWHVGHELSRSLREGLSRGKRGKSW